MQQYTDICITLIHACAYRIIILFVWRGHDRDRYSKSLSSGVVFWDDRILDESLNQISKMSRGYHTWKLHKVLISSCNNPSSLCFLFALWRRENDTRISARQGLFESEFFYIWSYDIFLLTVLTQNEDELAQWRSYKYRSLTQTRSKGPLPGGRKFSLRGRSIELCSQEYEMIQYKYDENEEFYE